MLWFSDLISTSSSRILPSALFSRRRISSSISLVLLCVRRPSVKRLKTHFITLISPASVLYSILIGSCICLASASEILAVTFSRPSLSDPCSYLQRMYSLGVSSRWFSMWWKACCATYATRQFGCFHTSPEPLSGSSSPVSSLIIVDLPAPFAPMHAARVESETRTVTELSCGFTADGYVNVTFVIFMMCFPREVMPSRLPGCGKRIVNLDALSSK